MHLKYRDKSFYVTELKTICNEIGINSEDVFKYVKKCLELDLKYGKKLTTIAEMRSLCKEIKVNFEEVSKLECYRDQIHRWGSTLVTKNVLAKSSLKSCSLPKIWWKKASYVNDTEISKILSEFRGGNARLGNRDNDLEDFAPTTMENRVVICPLCCIAENDESHMVIDCVKLCDVRKECFVDNKNIEDIFQAIRRKDVTKTSSEVLREFLNTDTDSRGTIRQKAEVLDFLRCHFISSIID